MNYKPSFFNERHYTVVPDPNNILDQVTPPSYLLGAGAIGAGVFFMNLQNNILSLPGTAVCFFLGFVMLYKSISSDARLVQAPIAVSI